MEKTNDEPEVRKVRKLPESTALIVDILLSVPNLRLENIKFRPKKTTGSGITIIGEDKLRKDYEKSSNP
jgi:hypothetical protein